jgi:hypothetical protein
MINGQSPFDLQQQQGLVKTYFFSWYQKNNMIKEITDSPEPRKKKRL